MTDSTQSAREDLAYLRALAADQDPLPWTAGAQLFTVGGVFGLNLAAVGFLILRGQEPAPVWLWCWLPGMAVYAPASLIIHLLGRKDAPAGPSARMLGAAWLAVHAMTLFIILALVIASRATGIAFVKTWPAIAWSLYGGVWLVSGFVRKTGWAFVIALGCFAFALAIASQVDKTGLWLALGLAAIWAFGAPGWIIMRQARRAD